ncbi:unnamed protein product [Onchocerca flexuosa]|uniref:VWFA domain-containing protein n=1 Tax=Onchocerca flexuosa TaxID=387005 RepID=A0A183GY93_9BILA|nr:unnamed protein product [Onchocerca flexuosa]
MENTTAIIAVLAVLTKVTLLARQRKTITQLTLDIDKTMITSATEIVSDIDESFPVLIALDVGKVRNYCISENQLKGRRNLCGETIHLLG